MRSMKGEIGSPSSASRSPCAQSSSIARAAHSIAIATGLAGSDLTRVTAEGEG